MYQEFIRDVPDFPNPGILYKDITPLLANADATRDVVQRIAQEFQGKDIDLVLGAESRGFIFGVSVALELGAGFVPVRKPGKLPCETLAQSYGLEYGNDTLEIHTDAISKGQRVLLVDDLLATGGTMDATVQLVKRAGGNVAGIATVIELTALEGRKRLEPIPLFSLIQY